MPRRLATLAGTGILALALSASPALASPVTVFPFPAAGESVVCGDHTYTFTAGDFLVVARDTSTAAHLTARHVWATDDDQLFRVVGAETYNDPAGRLTSKLMFISPGGGIADSVNIVARYDKDGNLFVGVDQGTCGF
jgi:hypothetical protein